MQTGPSVVARLLAAVAALLFLPGCPSLDDVFDESRIHSVTIDPDPVPTPPANAASDFYVRVSFDSERDNDRLLIRIRNPHDGDRFKEIGLPVPCPNRREGGGCGSGTIAVPCSVVLSPNFTGERSIGCGTSRVDLGIGDYTLRVEMINERVDDTYNVTVRVR